MKFKNTATVLIAGLFLLSFQGASAAPSQEESFGDGEFSLHEVPSSVDQQQDWDVYVVDAEDLAQDLSSYEDEEIFGRDGLLEELLEYERVASGERVGRRIQPKALRRTCVAQNGKASWYSGAQKTANGENYNEHDLTAAHRTIPFHSLVKVTYKGRSVVVRINDAGPYISGRVIDLSRAAAKAIGIIEKGVANVQVQILRCGRG